MLADDDRVGAAGDGCVRGDPEVFAGFGGAHSDNLEDGSPRLELMGGEKSPERGARTHEVVGDRVRQAVGHNERRTLVAPDAEILDLAPAERLVSRGP